MNDTGVDPLDKDNTSLVQRTQNIQHQSSTKDAKRTGTQWPIICNTEEYIYSGGLVRLVRLSPDIPEETEG
jgi:hypothetical protein